jgi:hypothetical protein
MCPLNIFIGQFDVNQDDNLILHSINQDYASLTTDKHNAIYLSDSPAAAATPTCTNCSVAISKSAIAQQLCLSIREMQRTGAQNVNIDSDASQGKLSVALEFRATNKSYKNWPW